jgi:hypothetical protein
MVDYPVVVMSADIDSEPEPIVIVGGHNTPRMNRRRIDMKVGITQDQET